MNNSNFDVVGIATGIIGTVLTVFIVDDIKLKIIICMSIFIIVLLIKIAIISIQKNKIQKSLEKVESNRNSIKQQYLAKKRKVDTYELYWAYTGKLFELTYTDSAEERIYHMYNLYVMFTERLNKEK